MKPQYIQKITDYIHSTDLTKYKDSMRPLIEKDIAETEKALTLYNTVRKRRMKRINATTFEDAVYYGRRSCFVSKYDGLWRWIAENGQAHFKLTYTQIKELAGVPIDHSFLSFKKELLDYGYKVVKISMKEETVAFEKVRVE